MAAIYDQIGRRYAGRRAADPRIEAMLREAMGDAGRIINIGAGTGSYEPADRQVVAVEPSITMLAQRPADAAPAVQAVAEALPFADDSFDLALGILTIHHWTDWRRGLREAMRVSGGNVLLLTWYGRHEDHWLAGYFPEIIEQDRAQFSPLSEYATVMGELTVTEVPIPHDCIDGFLYAYWRRPEAYLEPAVRSAISSLARIPDLDAALARLREDLASGRWQREHGHLMDLDACDFGYKLVRTAATR